MGFVALAHKVAEATTPVTGLLLKNIAEGSLVKLNENGSPVEFYVAKHDYEPSLNGNGRTLLVRKNLHSKRNWDDTDSRYSTSSIDAFLNGTYKAVLDTNVQTAIGTTTIYSVTIGGTGGQLSTLERAVFIPSVVELGGSGGGEGSALPIKDTLREGVAVDGTTSNTTWWTRTPYADDDEKVAYVSASGSMAYLPTTSLRGVRPCFTLPSSSVFNEETLLFEEVV